MNLTIYQILEKAISAHKKGNFELAQKYYKLILKSHRYQPDANYNLGIIFLSHNKIDKALKFFKIALEANPKIEKYWSSYIETLINENYYDIAKKYLLIGKKKGLSEKMIFYLTSALEQATTNITPPQFHSPCSRTQSSLERQPYTRASRCVYAYVCVCVCVC